MCYGKGQRPVVTFYLLMQNAKFSHYNRQITLENPAPYPLGKKVGTISIQCSSTITFTKQLTFTLSGENKCTLILFLFWITFAGEEMSGCGKILRGEVTGLFTFVGVGQWMNYITFFVGVTEGSCGPTFPPTSSVDAGNGWEKAVYFDFNVIIKAFFLRLRNLNDELDHIQSSLISLTLWNNIHTHILKCYHLDEARIQ